MVLTSEIIRSVMGEADAQAVYREVCKSGDEIEYYKPAVKSIRSRILSGKYQ